MLESKINTIPNVKVALEGVNNQYETAKKVYDEILSKYNDAQQQVQRESNSQGETISVVDPAKLSVVAGEFKKISAACAWRRTRFRSWITFSRRF
jgi:exonuclease VII small subunit